jgi:hypothetical protein
MMDHLLHAVGFSGRVDGMRTCLRFLTWSCWTRLPASYHSQLIMLTSALSLGYLSAAFVTLICIYYVLSPLRLTVCVHQRRDLNFDEMNNL